MRSRMMSARCCCGGSTPGCDPITGKFEQFDVLDEGPTYFGKWQVVHYTHLLEPPVPLVTVADSLLRVEYPTSGGTRLMRCAVWDADKLGGLWPSTFGLQYRVNFSWGTNSVLDGETNATIEGSLWPVLHLGTMGDFYPFDQFVLYNLRYRPGKGWSHRFEVLGGSYHETAIFDSDRYLQPRDFLNQTLILNIAPRPSQEWYATVTFNGETVITYPNGSVPKPTGNDTRPFYHGVHIGAYSDLSNVLQPWFVHWFELDEWKYL